VARISPINVRFRSKSEICHDVSFVLNCTELHIGTKHAVVDQVLWVWTEFDGKHVGCKYWSKEAVATRSKRNGLIHEHLVPRKIVRDKLFGLRKPTTEAVRRTLTNWCVGVVVTAEEDQRLNAPGLNSSMPKTWDKRDRWARYKAASIAIASEADR
jgi:hypothetical protein